MKKEELYEIIEGIDEKLKIASDEKIAREEMQNKIQIAHINAKKAASKRLQPQP